MIRVLSLLLVAQLALTVYLYWPQASQSGKQEALLAGVSRDAVQTITVSGEASELVLRRGDDRWILPDGLPADTGKVNAVLDALLESDPGYPIANSDSAAQRFEVADDAFERRLALALDDGASRVVYLGSSPAFRKVHARAADSEGVYVLALNSYDVPTAAAGWLDRRLLSMANIDAATLGTLALTLSEDAWRDAGGTAVDAQAAEDLVQALASLQVTGTATEDERALAVSDNSVLTLSATADGEVQALTLYEHDDGFLLNSSRYDALFAVSSYDAGRLRDAVQALAPDAVRENAALENPESEGPGDSSAAGESEEPGEEEAANR